MTFVFLLILQTMNSFIKTHAKRIVAIALILFLYTMARLPSISDNDLRELADRFQFSSQTLPEVVGPEKRRVRPLHSSLQQISAWMSSVGAAVALNDLDGDQYHNDVCYVDTRTDQVIIAPAPGTGDRYFPFTLDPGPQFFDRKTMAPMGSVPGDLNEDGLTDVLVYYWGRTPIAFLRREQPTSDADSLRPDSYVASEIVPGGERWYTNAATCADVDGDGHIDVIVGNYVQDGSRTLDVTAGGTEEMGHSMSRAFNGGRNRLLLWQGGTSGDQPTVKFGDVPGIFDIDGPDVATGWTLAVGAADLDGDMLPELYFSNDFGPDRLLHNRTKQTGVPRFALLTGRRSFTTPSSKVVGCDSFKGMGVDFGDLNGDGIPDIYVSNIASPLALEESHFAYLSTGDLNAMKNGRAPYVDASEQLGLSRSGWGWEARLADFDNDGVLEALQATGFVQGDHNRWPELHEVAMGNDQLLSGASHWHYFRPGDDLSGHDHNPFFVRASSGRFYDVAPLIGMGDPQISRGIATADVDGDGNLDFAVANQWQPSRFFHNERPHAGSYLGLKLLVVTGQESLAATAVLSWDPKPSKPPISARPAIGATATVYLPDRKLVGQVDGGNGHSGKRSPDLQFGLNDFPQDKEVQVDLRWRDPQGRVCTETQYLMPGWHTLVLMNHPKPPETKGD